MNLSYGSYSDNAQDAIKHGTHHNIGLLTAKLKEQQIDEIRNSREFNTILAERYDVEPSTISFIKRGLTWKGIHNNIDK